jgi:hypothetical protein
MIGIEHEHTWSASPSAAVKTSPTARQEGLLLLGLLLHLLNVKTYDVTRVRGGEVTARKLKIRLAWRKTLLEFLCLFWVIERESVKVS